MSLFLDNDVLEKLASWDLLVEGVRALGAEMDAVFVLPTAKYRLGLVGKGRRSKLQPEAIDRLRAFLSVAKVCSSAPIPAYDYLTAVDDIDAGEAILIVHALQSMGSVLITGDKRCIVALANAANCASLVAELVGRVMCLEQVLLRLIDALGFESVRGKIVGSNALSLDTAVMAAFGSGMRAEARNARYALEHRVQSLAGVARGLLVAQEYRCNHSDAW